MYKFGQNKQNLPVNRHFGYSTFNLLKLLTQHKMLQSTIHSKKTLVLMMESIHFLELGIHITLVATVGNFQK